MKIETSNVGQNTQSTPTKKLTTTLSKTKGTMSDSAMVASSLEESPFMRLGRRKKKQTNHYNIPNHDKNNNNNNNQHNHISYIYKKQSH
jgi:hypothetical protein